MIRLPSRAAGRHARRTVRVPSRELLRLYRGALQTAELEQQIAARDAISSRLEAQATARTMLADAVAEGGVLLSDAAAAALVDDPPVDASGRLHATAFRALAESHVWDLRLGQVLADSTSSSI